LIEFIRTGYKDVKLRIVMGLNIFLRSNTNSAAAMAIKVYKGSSPKKYTKKKKPIKVFFFLSI
jgi:hypothetical protein